MTTYVSTPIAGVNGNTQTLTVGSVTNGLLVVSIGWRDGEDIPGVTWDGAPLTKAVSEWESRGNNSRNSAIWYLVGPAAKTASLVVDHLDDAFTIVSATIYDNVDQTTPIRAVGSIVSNGNSFPLNATVTTIAGDHVFCRYQGSTATTLSTSTATKIWESNPTSSTNAGFRDTASGTSYTFNITGSGGGNRHTACAIALVSNPNVTLAVTGVSASAAVGTFGSQSQFVLTGVSAVSEVGTPVPSTAFATTLTGVGVTGTVGNLFTGGNVTLALTGIRVITSVGSLTTAGSTTRGVLIDSPRIRMPSFTLPASGFFPVGTVLANTTASNPSSSYSGTWTLLGTQSIGGVTVSYYERTA